MPTAKKRSHAQVLYDTIRSKIRHGRMHKKKGDAPRLRNEIIAGVTVALILIPQSLAYAQLAGLPPQYGLYAAFIPPLIAAIFGSSKQLSTGPVAILSLITATAISSRSSLLRLEPASIRSL